MPVFFVYCFLSHSSLSGFFSLPNGSPGTQRNSSSVPRYFSCVAPLGYNRGMRILVTGGAGYIGSITNRILEHSGYETVVFDSLKNGHRTAVGDTKLVVGDLTIKSDIEEVFK